MYTNRENRPSDLDMTGGPSSVQKQPGSDKMDKDVASEGKVSPEKQKRRSIRTQNLLSPSEKHIEKMVAGFEVTGTNIWMNKLPDITLGGKRASIGEQTRRRSSKWAPLRVVMKSTSQLARGTSYRTRRKVKALNKLPFVRIDPVICASIEVFFKKSPNVTAEMMRYVVMLVLNDTVTNDEVVALLTAKYQNSAKTWPTISAIIELVRKTQSPTSQKPSHASTGSFFSDNHDVDEKLGSDHLEALKKRIENSQIDSIQEAESILADVLIEKEDIEEINPYLPIQKVGEFVTAHIPSNMQLDDQNKIAETQESDQDNESKMPEHILQPEGSPPKQSADEQKVGAKSLMHTLENALVSAILDKGKSGELISFASRLGIRVMSPTGEKQLEKDVSKLVINSPSTSTEASGSQKGFLSQRLVSLFSHANEEKKTTSPPVSSEHIGSDVYNLLDTDVKSASPHELGETSSQEETKDAHPTTSSPQMSSESDTSDISTFYDENGEILISRERLPRIDNGNLKQKSKHKKSKKSSGKNKFPSVFQQEQDNLAKPSLDEAVSTERKHKGHKLFKHGKLPKIGRHVHRLNSYTIMNQVNQIFSEKLRDERQKELNIIRESQLSYSQKLPKLKINRRLLALEEPREKKRLPRPYKKGQSFKSTFKSMAGKGDQQYSISREPSFETVLKYGNPMASMAVSRYVTSTSLEGVADNNGLFEDNKGLKTHAFQLMVILDSLKIFRSAQERRLSVKRPKFRGWDSLHIPKHLLPSKVIGEVDENQWIKSTVETQMKTEAEDDTLEEDTGSDKVPGHIKLAHVYMTEHDIGQLFDEMMTHLVLTMPSDPLTHLIEFARNYPKARSVPPKTICTLKQ